jgi:hypothetical protein
MPSSTRVLPGGENPTGPSDWWLPLWSLHNVWAFQAPPLSINVFDLLSSCRVIPDAEAWSDSVIKRARSQIDCASH